MKCTYCQRDTLRTRASHHLPLSRTVDHVIPLSRGGKNTPENRVPSCRLCNGLKDDMMPDEWEAFMRENPEWWLLPYGRAINKAREKLSRQSAVCPVMAMVAQFFVEQRYGVWVPRTPCG